MPWNRKDYPPDWDEIRARILDRALNKCECCGLPNHCIIRKKDRVTPGNAEWQMFKDMLKASYSRLQAMKRMQFTQVVLTIAHLNHDKENWDVEDKHLAALCQKCHLKCDLPRHISNRKYGRNHSKQQYKLW